MGIAGKIEQALGFAPTKDQIKAIDAVERWYATDKSKPTLIIRGFAGTGKTALLGALAQTMESEGCPYFLLAPTGRAAKVMGRSAGQHASTIHSHIYKLKENSGGVRIELELNTEENAVFIVDEASMLGLRGEGSSVFNDRSLLDDLIEHVFHDEGCRLLLIGDPAQLPPVGQRDSPALDPATMRDRYQLTVGAVQLREVVRQAAGSGVLRTATHIRTQLNEGKNLPQVSFNGYADVVDLPGYEMEDSLEAAYSQGEENAVVICRTNKQVLEYAKHIRARIFGFEEELCVGDRLMVVKNDTYWTRAAYGEPLLIANGEMVKVKRVFGIEEYYGSRYARLLIELELMNRTDELEVVCNLDVLNSDQPGLSKEQRDRIFENALEMAEGKSRREKLRKLRSDEYFMALHVKYAYAITCHKAQGGQWPCVFLDQGFVPEERLGSDFMRWTYTAITRAQEKLYFVNYPREQVIGSE
jgi:exodeoxyribonuclease-5